jgi:hypothetical protein
VAKSSEPTVVFSRSITKIRMTYKVSCLHTKHHSPRGSLEFNHDRRSRWTVKLVCKCLRIKVPRRVPTDRKDMVAHEDASRFSGRIFPHRHYGESLRVRFEKLDSHSDELIQHGGHILECPQKQVNEDQMFGPTWGSSTGRYVNDYDGDAHDSIETPSPKHCSD